jgi:hypothetical protein
MFLIEKNNLFLFLFFIRFKDELVKTQYFIKDNEELLFKGNEDDLDFKNKY